MKTATGAAGPEGRKRTKLSRLLELIVLLHAGPAHSAESLASKLGVSRRTLYRYLSTLSEASVPCYYDDVLRGYRVRADFLFSTPRLTPEEALALHEEVERAVRSAPAERARDVALAWSKVEAQLHPTIRTVLHRGRRAISNGDAVRHLDG